MFKFEDLNDQEKEIILCIGDDIKLPIIDPIKRCKSIKDIHKSNFKELGIEQSDDIMWGLYYKDIISFVPGDTEVIPQQ